VSFIESQRFRGAKHKLADQGLAVTTGAISGSRKFNDGDPKHAVRQRFLSS
jgi:hypothetical protein